MFDNDDCLYGKWQNMGVINFKIMNHNKFKKELLKIKKFLELTDWELSYQFEEDPWFVWECNEYWL